jgi:3-methyladenine DNA glycosylase Mpg
MPSSGGSTLTTLTPPANPKTGTWVVGTETFGGATPAASHASTEGVNHYTQLIYVPAIDCLAWIPGGNNPVYLLKPA